MQDPIKNKEVKEVEPVKQPIEVTEPDGNKVTPAVAPPNAKPETKQV